MSPRIKDGLVEDTIFELLGITDPERATHIRQKAVEITDEAFNAAGIDADQTSKKYIEIFRKNIQRLAEIYRNLKENKSPGGDTPMERLGEKYHEKWNNERILMSQGAVEQPVATLLPPIPMRIHQPQPHHPIQIKTEYATSVGTSMDTLGKAYKSLYEPPRENESARQYKTRLEAQDRHRSVSMMMNEPKIPVNPQRTKSPTRTAPPAVHFGLKQMNEQKDDPTAYPYNNNRQRVYPSPTRPLPIPPTVNENKISPFKIPNTINANSERSNGGRYSFIAPGPSLQQIPHESTLKNPIIGNMRSIHKETSHHDTKMENNRQYSFKNYAPTEEYQQPRTQRGLSLARGMSVPMIGGIAEAIEQHQERMHERLWSIIQYYLAEPTQVPDGYKVNSTRLPSDGGIEPYKGSPKFIILERFVTSVCIDFALRGLGGPGGTRDRLRNMHLHQENVNPTFVQLK